MEFTTSATRLQRPLARSSWWVGGVGAADSIRAFVSQATMREAIVPAAPRFAQDWTAAAAVSTWSQLGQPRRLSPHGFLTVTGLAYNSRNPSLAGFGNSWGEIR
jgi:hypothetical protein